MAQKLVFFTLGWIDPQSVGSNFYAAGAAIQLEDSIADRAITAGVALERAETLNQYAVVLDQHLRTTDSPTFAALTLSGLLTAAAGTISGDVSIGGIIKGALVVDSEHVALVKFSDLGSMAFRDEAETLYKRPRDPAGALVLSSGYLGNVVLQTGAADTTLPDSDFVPAGWHVWFKNRSGGNRNLVRGNTGDTINGSAASLVIADDAGVLVVHMGSGDWETI